MCIPLCYTYDHQGAQKPDFLDSVTITVELYVIPYVERMPRGRYEEVGWEAAKTDALNEQEDDGSQN